MPEIWDKTHKTDKRVIHIEPVTRLEGHAKIDIFLDNEGNVEETYFQVVELRGFEEFCKGRAAEEMPRIVNRLCGVCPWPHHIASSLVLDKLFDAPPPPAAHKIRELGYCAHMLESHLEHIYALGPAPDFILGPAADPAKRNILGVIEAVGLETGKKVIVHRGYAVEIENIIGGKSTHPVFSIPGGISRPLKVEERDRIRELAGKLVDFCEFTLKVVDDIILSNKDYMEIILNKDLYYHNSYHMGMVDENGRHTFYGGKLRVIDPDGEEVAKFDWDEYLDYVGEHPVPWSYLKFPYLKKVGWNGLTDGKESGLYRVAPLSRMNVAEGMATPKAQKAYQRFYETLGKKPVQNSLSFHWARAIESLYAAERLQELADDEDILSKEYRTLSRGIKGEGVGVIEAPRGTLFHHYKADDNGLITDLNLIVASAQNYGAMNIDIRNVARNLIKKGEVSNGILNMVEMGFRSYDPCFSCATHAAIGRMPMEIVIRNENGAEIRRIKR
ncbi:MAG: Ni/Fe hydrogenase subunit alpha [Spirochaetes bacterium]|nr:MAG: Ni/Fe hydrogenase subunit alpha [Spirochaetota bacterium]